MKSKKLYALLCMLCACMAANGASRSATMQVGLTIVESCSVRSAGAAPLVSCALASPYRIDMTGPGQSPAAISSTAMASDGVWQVSF